MVRFALAPIVAGGKTIARIAILGGTDEAGPCPPCGGCRQKILEFADEQTRVLLMAEDGGIVSLTVAEILPKAPKMRTR